MSQYRYPGANPFRIDQSHIFFGRSRDIEELNRFIQMEKLTILYSKSGLGKSSLINAGLIPKIKSETTYFPLLIRLGAHVDHDSTGPLETVKNALVHSYKEVSFINNLAPEEDSIWYHTKNLQLHFPENAGFILIFDQFEELFTYPIKQVKAFKNQLAELLYTSIPQRILEVVEPQIKGEKKIISEDQMTELHRAINVKAVFAIRSDKLHLMNGLSDYFPFILKKCYELGSLSKIAAEDAIINPALAKGDFFSPRFQYEDEAVEKIIAYLTKEGKQGIESFQLQILCQSLEKKVIDHQLKTVDESDIGNVGEIYENYYDDQINLLESPEERLAARKLIEEALIFEEEKRRISLYQGQIQKDLGISEDLLEKLVKSRLIRSELSPKGGFLYELSHDTLVDPILRSKERRLEKERKEAEEQAQREKEVELAYIRKKRRRDRRIAASMALLALISLVAFSYALSSRNIAVEQKKLAEEQKKLAEEQKGIAIEQQIKAENSEKLANSVLKSLLFEKAGQIEAKGDEFLRYNENQYAEHEYQRALKLLEQPLDSFIIKNKLGQNVDSSALVKKLKQKISTIQNKNN